MPKPLKVIQLTDCHVSANPDAVYRGIDPRLTFRSLLPAVRDWGPDQLLLTGDLAEDGQPDAYEFLRAQLQYLGTPVLTIPGNHDDANAQRAVFPDTAVEAPLIRDTGGWRIILLNSAAPGHIEGLLSDNMLAGLVAGLEEADAHVLVALHHQPLPTGSAWIDRYPLSEPERFWSVIDACSRVRAVCWGHIHHEVTARRGDIHLLGTPATAANSLPGQQRFTADPAGPACRWLELWNDGRVDTGLLRAG